MLTETDTETTQTMEDVLSSEQQEVSEITEEVVEEKKEEIIFTPEQEMEIEGRYQSRRDKELNPYREKREADTALIRSLTTQVKELKAEKGTRRLSKAMEAVLAGDEEEGLEPDRIEAKRIGFEEIKATIKDYDEKSVKVKEIAQLFETITEKMPSKVVKGFGLDDPNPMVRAKNYATFLDETVFAYGYNQNFLLVVENFLPKGDELRKQIDDIIDGFRSSMDDESKKLYVKDKLQGVKVTPRKKPQTPSDISGGKDRAQMTATEKVNEGLRQDKLRK